MRFQLFFTAILCTLANLAGAQTNTQDVLYLKNGSIIKGNITGQDADKLKIELTGGSIFVFETTAIDSIKKENAIIQQLKEIRHNYFHRDRGYRNMTELAIIYGVNFKNNPNPNDYYSVNQDDIGVSLQTINGYQVCPYFFAGAGLGIDRFITYQQTFSPFFVRLSSQFLKRKVTPYIYLDAGYSVMWKQPAQQDYTSYKNEGGAYFAGGGGVRIYTRGHASVLLSAGYKMNMSQSSWLYTYNPDDTYNIKRTYQRFVMNVGVSF